MSVILYDPRWINGCWRKRRVGGLSSSSIRNGSISMRIFPAFLLLNEFNECHPATDIWLRHVYIYIYIYIYIVFVLSISHIWFIAIHYCSSFLFYAFSFFILGAVECLFKVNSINSSLGLNKLRKWTKTTSETWSSVTECKSNWNQLEIVIEHRLALFAQQVCADN